MPVIDIAAVLVERLELELDEHPAALAPVRADRLWHTRIVMRGGRGDVNLAAQSCCSAAAYNGMPSSFGVLKSIASGLNAIACKISDVASSEPGSNRMVLTSMPTDLP